MSAFDAGVLETYKAEAQARWGNSDAYKEYAGKTKNYGTGKWSDLAAGMNAIFCEFALCMKNGETAHSETAQALVKKLQGHITENCYSCTNEILAGLGKMYVADERFKNNIDQHAEGTSAFISDAIAVYCGQ